MSPILCSLHFFVTESETSERVKQMMHMHLTMSCQSLTEILVGQYAQMQLETKANYLMTSPQVPNTSFLVTK